MNDLTKSCILIHPQKSFHDFLYFTGFVRYITTQYEHVFFFLINQFKLPITQYYKDLNLTYIMIEKYDKVEITTNLLSKQIKNVKNRFFFGEFDCLRYDSFKNTYKNSTNHTFDMYELYGHSTNIMTEYFDINRNLDIEKNILQNILMVANTKFTVLSCNKIPLLYKKNGFCIVLDTMFSKNKFFDCVCLFSIADVFVLLSSSPYTYYIYMLHLKYDICKNKNISIIIDKDETNLLLNLDIPNNWKLIIE